MSIKWCSGAEFMMHRSSFTIHKRAFHLEPSISYLLRVTKSRILCLFTVAMVSMNAISPSNMNLVSVAFSDRPYLQTNLRNLYRSKSL